MRPPWCRPPCIVKTGACGGLEPPVFTALGRSFTGCCRRRWATHALRSATGSNSHPLREPPGSGRIASPLAGTLQKTNRRMASESNAQVPAWERLASNEMGLSNAQAIHGGTHCNRNRIPCEIASASNGAPSQPGLRSMTDSANAETDTSTEMAERLVLTHAALSRPLVSQTSPFTVPASLLQLGA
jgi:hypothetical protein